MRPRRVHGTRSPWRAAAALATAVALATTFALADAARAQPAPEPLAREDRPVDVVAIALRAADSLRADRTHLRARLSVRTSPRSSPRSVEIEAWADRVERRSFVRTLAPPSEAGLAYLHLPPNVWSYQPGDERMLRLGAAALRARWLRSDFALDDFARSGSELDDYEPSLLRVEADPEAPGGAESYVVQYAPRASLQAVSGRMVSWIERERGVPTRREFYDVANRWQRTIRYRDVRPLGERFVPHRWDAVSVDGKGRESSLEILEIAFDAPLDDAIFVPRHLEPTR